MYLVGDSAVAAGLHELVGHDDSQRRSKGPLRAEAQRDFGVAGEIGAVDTLWRIAKLSQISKSGPSTKLGRLD